MLACPPSTWFHRSIREPATRPSTASPLCQLVLETGWPELNQVEFIMLTEEPLGQTNWLSPLTLPATALANPSVQAHWVDRAVQIWCPAQFALGHHQLYSWCISACPDSWTTRCSESGSLSRSLM